MTTITFKPKQITKILLTSLQDRSQEVLSQRFGLTPDANRRTLEAIGKSYGITRERVRQIESAALNTIRRSEIFQERQDIFEELKNIIDSLGSVMVEDELLSYFSDNENIQNHIHFYLILGDDFIKHKECDNFKTRWSTNEDIAEEIKNALHKLHASLSDEDILPESEIISKFREKLVEVPVHDDEKNVIYWLSISKIIDKNPMGEWGLNSSPNIRTKGVKDFAFLVLRQNGSPMHFTEVAGSVSKTFDRKCHSATCHNELIKDRRFVLVGRGTYGLSDWGYKRGVVREVIRDILKEEGPLSKEDVIDRVLKERFLKPNTIVVNLQNKKYFKKTKDGQYTLA